MLAHVLNMPRLKLYLNFERALSEAEVDRLREMVKRRAMREPLQHILGSTSFCGLEIKCSRAALVPRSETELLAECGWKFLSSDSVTGRAGSPRRRAQACAGGGRGRFGTLSTHRDGSGAVPETTRHADAAVGRRAGRRDKNNLLEREVDCR